MPPPTMMQAVRVPMMYPTPSSVGEASPLITALLYPLTPVMSVDGSFPHRCRASIKV